MGKGLDSGVSYIWKGMLTTELVRHMSELRKYLPPLKLEEVNVEEQMLLQLAILGELQGSVIGDENISVQHKVQAANAVSKAIADLADRQHDLYSSERVKRLETALIKAVREHMPEEATEAFLLVYARIAAEAGA